MQMVDCITVRTSPIRRVGNPSRGRPEPCPRTSIIRGIQTNCLAVVRVTWRNRNQEGYSIVAGRQSWILIHRSAVADRVRQCSILTEIPNGKYQVEWITDSAGAVRRDWMPDCSIRGVYSESVGESAYDFAARVDRKAKIICEGTGANLIALKRTIDMIKRNCPLGNS